MNPLNAFDSPEEYDERREAAMILQHLETFCTVVDEGSFTKAADVLRFSQPTVTKQVRALEEELDALLIDRAQREPKLTPGGELVYSYARRILGTLRECRSALTNLERPGHGDLGMAAVFTIALYSLPPILEEFRQSHPFVTIHVKTGANKDILGMVLRSEVDLGLTSVPISHAQIRSVPLWDDPVILIAGTESQWSDCDEVSPSDLCEIPMVSYQSKSQFRGFVDAHFEVAGITPNVVMEFDSHEVVKTMVRLGLGIAMVPESSVKDDLRAGRLKRLHISGFPAIARATSLIMLAGRRETPAMQAFVGLLSDGL